MDKILVESNDKMQEVIDWYQNNEQWLEKFEFKIPFKNGVIDFQEEEIKFEWKSIGNNVYQFYLYMQDIKIYTFTYYLKSNEIKNERLVPDVPKDKRRMMELTLKFDNTVGKCLYKWKTIMQFSMHFRKYVKSDNKKVSTVSAKTNKITTTNNSVKNLGVTYYIKEVPDMKDGKRNYTKPDHEVKFRDTYRHLKSGKVVYVKGGVRYKGKGTGEDIDKTYKI